MFAPRAFCQKGDVSSAGADLGAAIRRSPKFGFAYLERAILPGATCEQSLDDLDKALQFDPALSPHVAAERSWIFATSNDPILRNGQNALKNARLVLASRRGTEPFDSQAQRAGSILMATAHAELGDFAAAATWLSEAIELVNAEGGIGGAEQVADQKRAWLDRLSKSLQQRRPYRDQPGDTNLLILEKLHRFPPWSMWSVRFRSIAVMNKHLRLVLRNRPDIAFQWSDAEVALRRRKLFRQRGDSTGRAEN